MKRYIRSSTNYAPGTAKKLAQAVIQYLTDLGLKNVHTSFGSYGRKAGYQSAGVEFRYMFNDYDEERTNQHVEFLMNRSERYPTREAALEFINVPAKRAAYQNFLKLQELYGPAGTEAGHDPFRHTGGGFPNLDNALKADIDAYLHDLGYTDATTVLSCSGLHTIEEDFCIYIYLPKN